MIVIFQSIAITRHVYIVQNLPCGMNFSVKDEIKLEIHNILKGLTFYLHRNKWNWERRGDRERGGGEWSGKTEKGIDYKGGQKTREGDKVFDFTIWEWFMYNFYIGGHLIDNFMSKQFLAQWMISASLL